MNRRQFLLAAGTGAVATTAGCSTATGAVAPPTVPKVSLDENGWTQTATSSDETVFEQSFGPLTVEAVASSVTYEKTELARGLSEKTLGMVEATPTLFTATRIDLAPSLDELGPVRSEIQTEIEASARDSLESRLREAGLEDVTMTSTGTLAVDSGAEASQTEYRATYPVPDFEVPVTDDRRVTIESEDLEIESLLAVWPDDDGYLVAGGAYPAENYATSTRRELTDAISVSVDVDLGLDPAAHRAELIDLVRETT